ncbi:MAG: GGDEF domain-containing protein [Betaproteobacteria bacterium]|nr:GGDEF domain-containing protein [Betaproteobacteria bacterium]
MQTRIRTEPVLLRWVQGLALSSCVSLSSLLLDSYSTMLGSAFSGFVQVFGFALLMDAVTLLGGKPAPRASLLLPGIALAGAQFLQAEDPDSRRMLFYLVAGGQFIACAVLALAASRAISLRNRLLLAASFLLTAGSFGWYAFDLTSQALAFSTYQSPSRAAGGTLLIYISLLWASIIIVQIHFERSNAARTRFTSLDPLTGSLNRPTLLLLGQQEIARAQRHSLALSVLQIKIDTATIPREKVGYERILKHLSETLAATLQRQDLFGRIDEAEFGAILPDTSLDDARHVAERLRVRIETRAETESGYPYRISIGVAERAANELTPGQVLVHAEMALLRASQAGGNRVETAQERLSGRAEISHTAS